MDWEFFTDLDLIPEKIVDLTRDDTLWLGIIGNNARSVVRFSNMVDT